MAEIIIINIPAVSQKRTGSIKGLLKNIEWYNAVMSEVASQKSLMLADAYSLVKLVGPEKIMPQDFHYNVEGHKLMAKEITDKILTKVLN